MIFEQLIIYSLSKQEVLKSYQFNRFGLNIILGEKRTSDDETNGVGKSTMIECLEMILGKTISKHYELNKSLIENNIMIILKTEVKGDSIYFARVFNISKKGYSFRGSDISFDLNDWSSHSISEYKELIHDFIFTNEECEFTFASLREYIIRDEKKGYNEVTLLGRDAAKNHAYLSYLFGLPYNSEFEINEVKKEIDKLKQQVNYIESGINIKDLMLREDSLNKEISKHKKSIETFDVTSQYRENTKKYSETKIQLNSTQKEIFESEHIIKQYEKNIENLKRKTNDIKELNDIEPFYKQLVGYFPDNISQNYNDIKSFYDFMVENRGKYFKDKIEKLKSKLSGLNQKKEKLEVNLMSASELLKNNNLIDDITSMMNVVEKKQLELAEINVRVSEYNQRNNINDKINLLETEKLRITSIKNDEFLAYKEHLEYLQHIFSQLMDATYNQTGVLFFEYENSSRSNVATGRNKIQCSIPDEKSHGRQYMKINMFDLTWFLYRTKTQRPINFLVHDGSYSKPDIAVKPRLLKYVDTLLTSQKRGQYFVTINIDEMMEADVNYLIENKKVVAKLDRNNDENRFFGFRF